MRYTALLALAGAAAAAPAPTADSPGCSAPSAPSAPSSGSGGSLTPGSAGSSAAPIGADWTVSGFQYNASYVFSTPAHQNSWGYVHFTVTNPALGAAVGPITCDAQSSQLQDFFYGNQVYTCAGVSADPTVTTTFTFDASADRHPLAINQTWTGAGNKQYRYGGSYNLALACSDADYENPDWQQGEIYSNKTHACTSTDVTFSPAVLN